ncbi:Insulin like protein [Argiope bruennichi]|uniref:Insulin like protein n=1 Tax=Argiope bruennichi TaxID=94029 RepID=A0A8T0FF90_ARGBR|nr:Insulin like protein [Argiope bruennichi]
MVLRRSMFYVFGYLVLSVLYSDNAEGVRMCGRRLADLLNVVCGKHGGFYAPRTTREGNQETAEIEMTSNLRGGVVDECCRKQCSFTTLLSYCANSQYVESIDLEEMFPPGSEPAISAEDIAEFHDATKGMTDQSESSAILSHPRVSIPDAPTWVNSCAIGPSLESCPNCKIEHLETTDFKDVSGAVPLIISERTLLRPQKKPQENNSSSNLLLKI